MSADSGGQDESDGTACAYAVGIIHVFTARSKLHGAAPADFPNEPKQLNGATWATDRG